MVLAFPSSLGSVGSVPWRLEKALGRDGDKDRAQGCLCSTASMRPGSAPCCRMGLEPWHGQCIPEGWGLVCCWSTCAPSEHNFELHQDTPDGTLDHQGWDKDSSSRPLRSPLCSLGPVQFSPFAMWLRWAKGDAQSRLGGTTVGMPGWE